ncbi:serine hydrolase [Bhargavaea ullalensis]|uniref:Beta-lactamase class A n=1 Tax=Bhargavaea ullalensis TaxID=1265685 RepID=A0ABV2GCX6_9BACL
MSLQQKIEDVLKEQKGEFGIYIKHLQTGEEVRVHDDRLFQMASVFKVPILLTLFEQVNQSRLKLDQRITITEEDRVPGSGVFQEMDVDLSVTIKDLATMMIIVSDNLATDMLYRLLGRDAIQKTMDELGLEQLTIRHSCRELLCLTVGLEAAPYSPESHKELVSRLYGEGDYSDSYVLQTDQENNVCTPREMAVIFEKLASGDFISDKVCADILDILFRQQLGQRIPGRLPSHVKVAHKTGTIATTVNDAGIVYLPGGKGEYVISVFSVGNEETYKGAETIALISELAYHHFVENTAGSPVLAD